MLLPDLRKAVLGANLELVRNGLVLYTFGNASAISRKKSLVVIKPSGVPYVQLRLADLVITDLNGKLVAAIGRFLHDQHYLSKHGPAACYGQPKEKK